MIISLSHRSGRGNSSSWYEVGHRLTKHKTARETKLLPPGFLGQAFGLTVLGAGLMGQISHAIPGGRNQQMGCVILMIKPAVSTRKEKRSKKSNRVRKKKQNCRIFSLWVWHIVVTLNTGENRKESQPFGFSYFCILSDETNPWWRKEDGRY